MKEEAIWNSRAAVQKLLQNYNAFTLIPQAWTAPGSILVKLDEAGKKLLNLGEVNPAYKLQFRLLQAHYVDGISLEKVEERYGLSQRSIYLYLGRGLDFLTDLIYNNPPPSAVDIDFQEPELSGFRKESEVKRGRKGCIEAEFAVQSKVRKFD